MLISVYSGADPLKSLEIEAPIENSAKCKVRAVIKVFVHEKTNHTAKNFWSTTPGIISIIPLIARIWLLATFTFPCIYDR